MVPSIAETLMARGADVNRESGRWIGQCCTGNSGHKEKPALADALQRVPDKRSHIVELMNTDADLAGLRGNAGFRRLYQQLNVGH